MTQLLCHCSLATYHKLVNKLPGTTQWLPQRLLRPPTSSVASSSSRGNNGFLCLFLRVESFTLTLIMSEGSLLTFQKQITMASYLSIFIHHVIVHEEAWMHFASYLETFLFLFMLVSIFQGDKNWGRKDL